MENIHLMKPSRLAAFAEESHKQYLIKTVVDAAAPGASTLDSTGVNPESTPVVSQENQTCVKIEQPAPERVLHSSTFASTPESIVAPTSVLSTDDQDSIEEKGEEGKVVDQSS